MSTRPFIWILCAGALVFACARVRHNEASADPNTIELPAPTTAHPLSDAHALSAATHVTVARDVAFAMDVTNFADHKVEVRFPSGQTHDFVVLDSIGREVWRWSTGRLFTQGLRNKLLDSREHVTYDERWSPRGRHGRFTALAILRSSNHPIEQKVDFTLP